MNQQNNWSAKIVSKCGKLASMMKNGLQTGQNLYLSKEIWSSRPFATYHPDWISIQKFECCHVKSDPRENSIAWTWPWRACQWGTKWFHETAGLLWVYLHCEDGPSGTTWTWTQHLVYFHWSCQSFDSIGRQPQSNLPNRPNRPNLILTQMVTL